MVFEQWCRISAETFSPCCHHYSTVVLNSIYYKEDVTQFHAILREQLFIMLYLPRMSPSSCLVSVLENWCSHCTAASFAPLQSRTEEKQLCSHKRTFDPLCIRAPLIQWIIKHTFKTVGRSFLRRAGGGGGGGAQQQWKRQIPRGGYYKERDWKA